MTDDELLKWADDQQIHMRVPPDGLGKVKALAACIRQQRDLLDECENMIATLRINESGETRRDADALLARLRSQEKADE